MAPDPLSLFMPFYNEASLVEDVVDDTRTILDRLEREYELLLVDDGSTDGTADIIDDLVDRFDAVRAVHHDRNRGYGRALATGFFEAQHPLVGYIDGDGQFDPAEIDRFLDRIDDHDLVVGYREERQDRFSRRFMGVGFNVLTRAMLPIGVRDIDCGFKLVRQDLLDQVTLRTQRTVDAELLAKAGALGARIAEVPVTHRARDDGVSEADGLIGVRTPLILKTVEELWTIRGDLP